MFSTLRNRFGIPGIISVIALVFAMFGGAYAASNSSGGHKATASAKKGPRGPKGPKGDTGPAGPAGPTGPAGAKGDTGAAGSNGTNGTNGAPGAPGTSVTNTALAKGNVNCPEGGAEFKVGAGTPTRACNGVTGFTKTLPSGETETGTWSISANVPSPNSQVVNVPISFSIPLSQAGPGSAFGFTKEETANEEFGTSGCTGTVAKPTAPAGKLCVYTGFEVVNGGEVIRYRELKSPESVNSSYGVNGAILLGGYVEGTEEAGPGGFEAWGSWAVTAP